MIDPPGKLIRRWNKHTASSLPLSPSVSLSLCHTNTLTPHLPLPASLSPPPPPNLIFRSGRCTMITWLLCTHKGWIKSWKKERGDKKKRRFFQLQCDRSETLSVPRQHRSSRQPTVHSTSHHSLVNLPRSTKSKYTLIWTLNCQHKCHLSDMEKVWALGVWR